ncbi:MAG: cyanophycinase [Planctomycetaceae bacterium]|nr:MAG: cyanophycinase [Planctomycetaceae bacterium]
MVVALQVSLTPTPPLGLVGAKIAKTVATLLIGLLTFPGPAAWADENVANPDRATTTELAERLATQHRIEQEGYAGTLILGGSEEPTETVRRAFLSALPKDATVVVVDLSGEPKIDAEPSNRTEQVIAWLRKEREPEEGPNAAIALEVTEASTTDDIATADAVWLCAAGSATEIAAEIAGGSARFAEWGVELMEVLRRGGVVGASGVVAGCCGAAWGSKEGTLALAVGWDLLTDALIDIRPQPDRRTERLRTALAAQPHRVAIAIDEPTGVMLRGRRWEVLGDGTVGLALAAAPHRDAAEMDIPAGSMADWVQLRRAARWRGAGIDPGVPTLGPPTVESGSLVIVGGGGMPQSVVDRFVQLAGGSEARIVVLPTAVSREEAFASRPPRFLTRAGVASVKMLPQSRTAEVADEEFREALAEATGVWFDGGRQWNFVDAYENTDAVELFHDVLRRGGVIGGSSAGATIQGEYLVRGHPLGNRVMMAEGYERGFGFLPGVAIDQHFTQRGRHPDLLQVVRQHPKLIGIGIDEATALVVSGSRAEVIGKDSAHFIAGPLLDADPDDGQARHPPFITVASGGAIDLLTLEPIAEAVPDEDDDVEREKADKADDQADPSSDGKLGVD